MEVKINDTNITVSFFKGNILIENSYQIKNDKDKEQLLDAVINSNEYITGNYSRTKTSYLREWKAHNTLYEWGISPERTGSVDLNDDESLLRRICYFFLSKLEKTK